MLSWAIKTLASISKFEQYIEASKLCYFQLIFPWGLWGWGLKSATGQLMTEEGDTEVAKSTPASSVPAASINPPKRPQKVKRRPKWQKVHLQYAPVKTKGLDARFQGRRCCNNARLVWPWSRPRDPWLGGTSQLTLCCNNYKAGL